MQLGESESQGVIQGAIENAISKWCGAAQTVSVTEGNSDANIQIHFEGIGTYGYGDPGSLRIGIDYSYQWANDSYLTTYQGKPDIYTIFVHEFGHIFLGAGHMCQDPNSAMCYDPTKVKRSLTQCDKDVTLKYYNPIRTVVVTNSFNGGSVYVDGGSYSSGSSFPWRQSTFPHTLQAVDQDFQSIHRVYQWWENDKGGYWPGESNRNLSIQALSATYTAWFVKEYNVRFENHFSQACGGVIKVSDQTRDAPYLATIREPIPGTNPTITVEAIGHQVCIGIDFTFSSWKKGGNTVSTTARTTFTIDNNATYAAYFVGKPILVTVTGCGGPAGTPIYITWEVHPNQSVTYEIWRQVKHNGVLGNPQQIASASHNTTSYTDNDYLNTSGYTDDLLYYDVRAYYPTEQTRADHVWHAVFGKQDFTKIAQGKAGQKRLSLDDAKPTEYSVQNYPNPFNPTTVFNIQLPQAEYVILKVFDVMGREVATLVDRLLPAGIHEVEFDGSSLSSGIYFYRVQAGQFAQVNKMLLAK